jgi:hypothetical protein
MVYSVKQLTDGFRCIAAWHRSGFISAFAPGDQKKLKGLPLNSLLLIPTDSAHLSAWPKPSAIAVVPATFNTLNKWALGIGDTLATSILFEYLGDDIPIVAVPGLKAPLARHPAFPKSVRLLKKWGVQILYDPRRYISPEIVPYVDVLSALSDLRAS